MYKRSRGGSIQMPPQRQELFILRIVQSVVRHLYRVVFLVFVLPQVVAARPSKNEDSKKRQKEQKTRFAGFIQFNIVRVVYLSAEVVVIRIH